MLLNRTTLGLAKLASKEESRYTLQAIAIEKDCAVATNGHYLVTVTHPQGMSESAYPETPGLTHRTVKEGETVLVSRDAALAALKSLPKKSTIPILGNAAMSEDGELVTNDLKTVGQFKHAIEGSFPNWRAVMPDAPVAFEVSMDARYLKLLAEYFIANCNDRLPAVRMTFYEDNAPMKGFRPNDPTRRNTRAMRFDARTEDGQNITAVLMPVHTEDSQFAMRPDQVRAAEEAKLAKDVAVVEESAGE